mgnify:FL=1
MDDQNQICEAFDWIRQYAVREGWIPIRWKDFRIGPWRIRVNGTPTMCQDVPPWHALIEHEDIIALLLIHPMGGIVGG